MTAIPEVDGVGQDLPPLNAARPTGLARNSVYNLLGQVVPFVAALVVIPALVRGLGTDRFGVLTLAWMVIGYFGLFDLGLGRALTQLVASTVRERHSMQAPPLAWTALALMFGFGMLGSAVVIAIAPWLVQSALKIPPQLQPETVQSFYVLAAAIPFVVVGAGLSGILSAFQRFGLLNAIRAPMGVLMFLAPLIALQFSQDLLWITASLATARLLASAALLVACAGLMPRLRSGMAWNGAEISALFRFGAWMTVTNIVGPLLVYLDRFVIGTLISVAAVAYYATPYEMVTKLLIVPGAVLGVVFPAIAASYQHDQGQMVRLFARGMKYILLLLFPVILAMSAFAYEGLHVWLGEEFASNSAPVLRWLAIGVFINSFAQVFFTLLQGVGRPDLSAKLHIAELPVYLLALWWAIAGYGILGAAIAWTGRVILDTVLLFWMSVRFLGDNRALLTRATGALLASIAAFVVPASFVGVWGRALATGLIMVAFVPTAWFLVLAGDERTAIRKQLGWL